MQFDDYIEDLLEQYTENYSRRIRKKYKNPALALGQAEQGEKVGKDGRSIPKHEEDKVSDKDYKAPYSDSSDREDAEDISGEMVDEFHRALDELIHKYLGHSSDEAEDDEDGNPDLFNSGYEDDYEEDAEGKVDKDRMKCNSPRRTSGGSKKFVVKACKDGKEKIVRFGDPNMKIKKSNPKRRKSFRARHKCDQKKDKFSAGYWSCKKW